MKIEFLNPDSLCPTFGWTHVVAATGLSVAGALAALTPEGGRG